MKFSSIAKSIVFDSFIESKEDFLEKGKKAQVGEIREWRGQKFQKQPNGGWLPVKQQSSKAKKESEHNKFGREFLENHKDQIVNKMPEGWKVDEEAKTTPNGYKWINNGKSRFGSEFEQKLIKEEDLNKKESLSSEEKENYLKKFFDPHDMVDSFLTDGRRELTFSQLKELDKKDTQSKKFSIEDISSNLKISKEEAEEVYDKWSKKTFDEIEKNPEKYGLKSEESKESSYNEEFGLDFDNVRDIIGDNYSNTVIQTALEELSENGWDKSELIVPKNARQSPASASKWCWERATKVATDLEHYTKDEVENTEELAYGIIQALTFYDNEYTRSKKEK